MKMVLGIPASDVGGALRPDRFDTRWSRGVKPLPHFGIPFGVLAVIFLTAFGHAYATFDFDAVRQRAQSLAAQPYVAPAENIPAWMQSLNYEQHRAIRFDRAHALWGGDKQPFQLQFFHPGWLFRTPVKINEVTVGDARPVVFSRDLYDYGQLKVGPIPPDLGFAGLRIHYPLVRPTDELAVFSARVISAPSVAGCITVFRRVAWRSTPASPARRSFRVLRSSGLNVPPPARWRSHCTRCSTGRASRAPTASRSARATTR